MRIMTGTNKQQAGFSIIEIVTTVVVVGLIVGAGWFAYQHNRPQAGNATPDNNQPIDKPNSAKPGPTVAYLEVKEWGVKIPLSEEIKDAYYISGGSSEGLDSPPNKIWLGIKSKKGANCDPGNNERGQRGALGAIIRVLPTTTDPITGELLIEAYPEGTMLGDYYYMYQSWEKDNPCGSESTLQKTDSAFAAAAEVITSTQTDAPN